MHVHRRLRAGLLITNHACSALTSACIQAGAVVEQGTHATLYGHRGSVYASLVRLQEQAEAADATAPLLAALSEAHIAVEAGDVSGHDGGNCVDKMCTDSVDPAQSAALLGASSAGPGAVSAFERAPSRR